MKDLARKIRIDCVTMAHRAKSSHVGSALSIADIVAVLYGGTMKSNDKFILSKGHACSAVYSAINHTRTPLPLETYGEDGSPLMQHISHTVPFVEFSTGSLGHGLPFGVGKALALRESMHTEHVYVLLSDGEMQEGSNWEALMFAAHHKLTNITAIIDYNNLQSLTTVTDTLNIQPLTDKLKAFGWDVEEVYGHSHEELKAALMKRHPVKPTVVIAYTIKGKGVSFMENRVEWHYKYPSDVELADALKQLEAA